MKRKSVRTDYRYGTHNFTSGHGIRSVPPYLTLCCPPLQKNSSGTRQRQAVESLNWKDRNISGLKAWHSCDVKWFIRSLTDWLTDQLINSLSQLLTYSLNNGLAHSLTDTLTHSLTRWLIKSRQISGNKNRRFSIIVAHAHRWLGSWTTSHP